MYKWIVRHVTLPLYQWHQGSTLIRDVRKFEQSAWYSREELRDMQWLRLKEMISHAFDQVPFYQSLFRQVGARPQDIKTFDDFARFPILSKETIQSNLDDLLAANVPRAEMHKGVTSGSSGQPTYYVQDTPGNKLRAAAGRRLLKLAGYDFGLRIFYLWRQAPYQVGLNGNRTESEPEAGRKSLLQRAKLGLYSRFGVLNPTYRVEPDLLSEEKMDRICRDLQQFKPDLIISYVSALHHLAQFIDTMGRVGSIRPRSIIVSSETLFPHQRETMERAFGCPVFNRYGMQETGIIAVDCPVGDGLHANSEILFLEYLKRSDGTHRLVVTDLLNRGMPLLRYDTGDSATPLLEPCPCGRGLDRMKGIQGRIIDLLPTRDGSVVDGQVFATLHWIPGIKQYQIIQKSIDHFVLRIVAGNGFSEENLEPMYQVVRQNFGEAVRIETEYREKIPFTSGGKYRLIVSEVATSRVTSRDDV